MNRSLCIAVKLCTRFFYITRFFSKNLSKICVYQKLYVILQRKIV